VISIQPIQGTFQPDSLIAARLVERLKTIPGVRTVALARREPLRGSLPVARVSIGKQQSETLARYNEVTSAYFSTLGIPIVRGRSFTEQETAAGDAAVAVISEATAQRFWPGEDPIGKTIDMATTQYSSGGREAFVGSSRTVHVIGVARDVISAWLWDGIDRTCIYLPATTSNAPYYSVLLSVRSDASLFQTELRSLLGSFDPVSDFDVRTMADVMDLQILPFRLASWGAAALGLLGLALASIGIYGVMAYVVNQRTREIAIRIAVGGGPGRVLWMILRDGLRLIAIAAAAGLTIALAFSRLIRAMLFRVDAADPLTFVVAPVVLGMVGLIAIYLASRKATRVDPNVTLRAE
jgi:hypothetical protein